MPRTTFEYAATREAALAQLTRLDRAVQQLPDDAFDGPTRLAGWTVGVLVAHTAASMRSVVDRLAVAEPALAEHTLLTYYAAARRVAPRVDERSRAAAAGRDPRALRAGFAAAADEAGATLRAGAVHPLVATRLGAIALVDFLVTRCIEGVVHGLDLGAATGLSTPEVTDPSALWIVVRATSSMLRERAPGRSVEVRVPGPAGAAFQCVEGPRHTRGTPPNVVEADPVSFVELAAGRVTWTDAVATGRVRARGERADLSAYLPLIG